MGQSVSEYVPIQDWEATPSSVRNLVLTLERERDGYREKLEQEHAQQVASEAHKRRLQRYHALAEQQFVAGLTPEQQQEIERLGEEIDAFNATFSPTLDSLKAAIFAHTGTPLK